MPHPSNKDKTVQFDTDNMNGVLPAG